MSFPWVLPPEQHGTVPGTCLAVSNKHWIECVGQLGAETVESLDS